MELGEDDKAAGCILRSLLSTSKMQVSEELFGNNFEGIQGNLQNQEQVVHFINSSKSNLDFITNKENSIQHNPNTYLTTEKRNLTLVNGIPIKYIVTQKMSDLPNNFTMNVNGISESQKVVFVQEVVANSKEIDDKIKKELDSPTEVHPQEIMEVTMTEEIVHRRKERKDDKNHKGKHKKRCKGTCSTKTKVEMNNSGAKQTLDKNLLKSKLKKLKASGKICRKSRKRVKNFETDNRRNKSKLFDLTQLEDNVEQVIDRLERGCECSETNCFDGLNPDSVYKHRLNIADLTKAEHDMYLMGIIMASLQNLDETCKRKERVRIRTTYVYQGKKVCLTAFLYLEHVTLYQMKILRSHLMKHGVSPRTHGNSGRKPANTFSLDAYRGASQFVQKYIEKHCLKTGHYISKKKTEKDDDDYDDEEFDENYISGISSTNHKKFKKKRRSILYYLPPECTKVTVHREYKKYCENLKPSLKAMKYSTFTSFLKKQFPYLKFQKKPDDKLSHCKCSADSERKDEELMELEPMDSESMETESMQGLSTNEDVPTVVYIPGGDAGDSDSATTYVVAPGNPHNVPSSQFLLNNQQFQFCGGNNLQLPNHVLVRNQIYGAQCISRPAANAHQTYTVGNIA